MTSHKFCGRIIDKSDVPAWHALRQEMALFDVKTAQETLRTCTFRAPEDNPHLIFDAANIPTIRQRLSADGEAQLRERIRNIMKDAPDAVDCTTTVCYFSKRMVTVAAGALLFQDETLADWARQRIRAILALETWKAPVHAFCRDCDHVMANTGADMAYGSDLLRWSGGDSLHDDLAEGLRHHLLLPYLKAVHAGDCFWLLPEYLGNWKIMTNGETGLALCAFAHDWPEVREALGYAIEGVAEILDVIPPEGDWPEGIGYWYATLFHGLRFGLALRRLTNGAVNILAHPRLVVSGDFAARLISPAGRCFAFGDNTDSLSTIERTSVNGNADPAECLLLLAVEKNRPDWLATARHFKSHSPLWLSLDAPDAKGAPVPVGAVQFPATGVGAMRTEDTWVGFRCGNSEVGHSHLDANSFVIEMGGETLVRDEGTWAYAHNLGFFDVKEQRWNFDALATVGHNTLLVDGQGQTYGKEHSGNLLPAETGEGWALLRGEASACYPGLLERWTRTLILMGRGLVVIHDRVIGNGPRHLEWLLHHGGTVTKEGDSTRIEVGGVTALLHPLLPDRSLGWRISDVVRQSVYENSNTLEMERTQINYRSFAPFRRQTECEFLFVLEQETGNGGEGLFRFQCDGGEWQLGFNRTGLSLRSDSKGRLHFGPSLAPDTAFRA